MKVLFSASSLGMYRSVQPVHLELQERIPIQGK